MAGILVVMWITPDMRISVALIPAWLIVLWLFHAWRKRMPGVVGAIEAADVGP